MEIFVACPQQPFLFVGQFVVGRVDREIEFVGVFNQLIFPSAHLFAAPAGHGPFVDGLALVRNDQIFVDADDLAVALASRTGSERIVETEKVFRRRFETDTVGFESGRIFRRSLVVDDDAGFVAVGECPRHRIADAGLCIIVFGHFQSVDNHRELFRTSFGFDFRKHIFDHPHLAVHPYAHQAVRQQEGQFLDDALPFRQPQRSGDDSSCARAGGEDAFCYIVDAVTSHFLSRYGRKCVPRAREKQFQIVVYLGRRADGRSRIACVDLLFDGDGRSNTRDGIDVRFVDFAEKLPCIGRQTFDVTALPLGEDGVECQRRFAGSRKTRDNDQFIMR